MNNLEIRCSDFSLTEAIRFRIIQQLGKLSERYDGKLKTVRLAITDLNGPKGGIDKRCVLRLSLQPRGQLLLEERGSDVYDTISAVARRAMVILDKRKNLHVDLRRRGADL